MLFVLSSVSHPQLSDQTRTQQLISDFRISHVCENGDILKACAFRPPAPLQLTPLAPHPTSLSAHLYHLAFNTLK